MASSPKITLRLNRPNPRTNDGGLTKRVAKLSVLIALVTLYGFAMGEQKEAASTEDNAPQTAEQVTVRPLNWQTRFTFEGQLRPGPYAVDPHIWVYTKEFAERFGMPSEWVDPELTGVEAAAWRKTKTGHVSCGWGGKKDACREESTGILEVYIDTKKVTLPWAIWASERKQMNKFFPVVVSRTFLTPKTQDCLQAKTRLSGLRSINPEPCDSGVGLQPFADPISGQEIFFYKKKVAGSDRGGFSGIYAYEKSAYPGLVWLQFGYSRIFPSYPEMAVSFRLETRDKPMGETLRTFHEFVLPIQFDRRVKAAMDNDRESEREFYKKSLILNKGS